MKHVLAFGLAVMLGLAFPPMSFADSSSRLASLGRVWLLVKYAHPRVALGSTDWDGPVLRAIEEMQGVNDDAAAAQVIGRMLATLNDPLTRVNAPGAAKGVLAKSGSDETPRVSRHDFGVVIDLRNAGDLASLAKQFDAAGELKESDVVVVDSRSLRDSEIGAGQLTAVLAPHLLDAPLVLPSPRSATIVADRREQTLRAGRLIDPGAGSGPQRAVFVVDPSAVVPSLAVALQEKGQGRIISVGGLPDLDEAVETIELPGGFVAQVRTQDSVFEGKRIELRADASLNASTEDARIYETARTIFSAPRERIAVEDPQPVNRGEREYAETRYPSPAHRILGVYRFWGAVHYFFAYPHLMDRPWDAALEEFIEGARDAKGELDYQQVIARMAARLQDNHVVWTGVPALQAALGGLAPQSAVVRYVEGKPVVARVLAGEGTELRLGDEILAVDGEPVAQRVARIEPYLSYSTPQGRDRLLADRLLTGVRGTRSRVQVRRDGTVLELMTTERGPTYRRTAERDGATIRVLEGNVGYVDVDRLRPAEVGAIYHTLRGTDGIIFDMRGYPEVGGEIVRWVNRKGNPVVGQTFQPQIHGGWPVRIHMIHHLSDYAQEPPERYRNRVVVLIDERAQSAAEAFAQLMKAAADATLIGGSTTGANGETTSVTLPGGVTVRFTRNDFRRPDGSQFQRQGHLPDIQVLPTIAGVSAGRDEVLERAMAYIRDGR